MRGSKTRSSKIAQIEGLPFIVPNLPFVGLAPPAIKPFIGRGMPSIGFQRFLGFTLIELLITFVIAAILLGLAYPNLRAFVQNNRLRTEASELFAAINQARTEAKASGGIARLCVSINQTTCAVAGTWDQGWLAKIWVDADGDSVIDVGEERILRTRPAPGNGIVLVSDPVDTTFSFLGSGEVSGALSFSVCDNTRAGEEGRSITFPGVSGIARLSCLPSASGTLCTIKPEDLVTAPCT